MALPLSGVRVLDLTRMVSGPWSTQLLGDLGADVIKIERPAVGDDMRTYGPPFLKAPDGSDDDSPYHLAVNRNKKSVTVDLANPEGAAVIKDLAKVCDIFVENFKAGDLKRYGLDFESIRRLNPAIIYCSVTGFGQTGPESHRPGLDSVFQATSGLMSMTGEPDGKPQKVGVAISDFIGGMYATVGILAALRHREVNGGEGQHIDIALLDCTIASFTNRSQAYLISGNVPMRSGSQTPGNQPADCYDCADGQIMLSAGSDSHFKNLCRLIGREEWIDDPRYKTRPLRVQNAGPMELELRAILKSQPRAHWLGVFGETGVMCAPINNMKQAFEEPQVKHRRMVIEAEHPIAGKIPLVANPIKFSGTPMPIPQMAPRLGAHTDEVLEEMAGLSKESVAALRERRAI